MNPTLGKALNICGFTLLGLCFAFSLFRVFKFVERDDDEGVLTIRFAHYQLEEGLREAFDLAAQAYSEIQPEKGKRIRVVQMAVPRQVYPTWLKTKLVGEMAPELMMIEPNMGITDELLIQYFLPLSDTVNRPNPYNDGTIHEGVPWRSTFFDGLNFAGFNSRLMENFGIPFTVQTSRVFYNRTLLHEVLVHPANQAYRRDMGGSMEPATFQEFIRLCEATVRYAEATGKSGELVEIAGSRANSPPLFQRLQASQTQKLLLEIDPLKGFIPASFFRFISYLRGEWGMHRQEVIDGYAITREVARYMQPGFVQHRREDATFRFEQEQAVMIVSSSFDAPSFWARSRNRFELGVFEIPLPDAGNPRFGRNVLGSITEVDARPSGEIGVLNRTTPERMAAAIDFLQFLTSFDGNQLFSENSRWLPCIIGITPPQELIPFVPREDGFPRGPGVGTGDWGQNVDGLLKSNSHLLYNPEGSLDEYMAILQKQYREALIADAVHHVKIQRQITVRQDIILGTHYWLSNYEPNRDIASDSSRKLDLLLDTQQGSVFEESWVQHGLSDLLDE